MKKLLLFLFSLFLLVGLQAQPYPTKTFYYNYVLKGFLETETDLIVRDSTLLELIQKHGGGSSSYIGEDFLLIPGDGEGNNYLDIQLDRDNDGYIDFYWWAADESQDLTFIVTPEELNYSTDHSGFGNYEFGLWATDNIASTELQFLTPFGNIRFRPQLSGSLTDGAPTAAEITAVVGISAYGVSGTQLTIKDTDGSGLLYKIESDGSNWFYTVMTKAL
jgi:hypothetical protein